MRVRRFVDLAEEVRSSEPRLGPTRLVGVDGRAGSGKTTFAARLARALGGPPVVHLDDLAHHEDFFGWVPRLDQQVLAPLRAGRAGRVHVYDWVNRVYASWVDVPPAPVVLCEGVGAARAELDAVLAYRVWVDVPPEVGRTRGLARDGEALRDFWREWTAAEARHLDRDRPWRRADLVVDGAPTIPHDPERELVVRHGL